MQFNIHELTGYGQALRTIHVTVGRNPNVAQVNDDKRLTRDHAAITMTTC